MWGLPAQFGIDPNDTYVSNAQFVSITINAGSSSNTATISTANTSTSFIVFLGQTYSTTGSPSAVGSVTLTNATTVTATRSGTTGTLVINCLVITGSTAFIKSIQYGTVSANGNNSVNATISSVTTSCSAVFYLGQVAAIVNDSTVIGGVTLTNSTTVTGRWTGSPTTNTISFVVVEFQPIVIKSIQQFSPTYTTNNTTDTQAITSVAVGNSIIAYGGMLNSVTNPAVLYRYSLSSATNVNLVRGAANTTSRTAYFTVIEFIPRVVASTTQRGSITLNNVTSNTATINAIPNIGKVIMTWNGFTQVMGVVNQNVYQMKTTLTNSTTITATVNTAFADNHIVNYEIMQLS